MGTGIVNRETVSLHQMDSTALVRNVQIQGWSRPGAKLLEFSHNGRLFINIVGTTVSLYRSINDDGTFTAGDKVLEGTGAENALITLAEQNSSGLNGYLRYTGAGICNIIFAYASEQDLVNMLPGDRQQIAWPIIATALTEPNRLEDILNEAKREVDDRLVRDMQRQGLGELIRDSDGNITTKPFPMDTLSRFQLGVLSNPEELKKVTCWRALLSAVELLLGTNEYATIVHKKYGQRWKEDWENLRLEVDADTNRQHDGSQRVSGAVVKPLRR